MSNPGTGNVDVVICGGGVAGLWLLNTLSDRGYSVILIEKETIGGTQTLGAQGMIHGGQKYLIRSWQAQADLIAALPLRWNACLSGLGDIDLSRVQVLAERQVMWPAGGLPARLALLGAAQRISTRMGKITVDEYPEVFKQAPGFTGPVYALPEKVLNMTSLVSALSLRYQNRMVQGVVHALDRNGRIRIADLEIDAQVVISAAGVGNEEALRLLGVTEVHTQRRPLRQIMVKTMRYPLYGHGVELSSSPRVTITSYPSSGGYIWYLGGSLASKAASLSEQDAIAFAKKEMSEVFPYVDWSGKEWATWCVDRAEPYDVRGQLPEGPVVQEFGKVWLAWPTKFTLVPLLSDEIVARLQEGGVQPKFPQDLVTLPQPSMGSTPWERTEWVT